MTVNSATQITIVTASGAPGTRQVEVDNGNDTTAIGQYAYYAPPTIAAAFAPTSVTAGGAPSTLTVTLTNPSGNPGAISGTSFTATAQNGLVLTGVATTCGGNATISGQTLSLANGGSLAANASCTVTASATSATPGSYTLTPGAPSSTTPALTGSAGTAATLTVTAVPPSVTAAPADQTVAVGGTASFTATASGSPTPTVQWQVSTDGTNFTNITGATATTYSFTAAAADNGKRYRAVFTNGGGTATTTAALLTVTRPPTVSTNPTDQTVSVGATATFSATADGSPTPAVQWEVSVGGGAYTPISGATATSYTTPATTAGDNGNRYHAVFTNSTGTATSSAATLTVVQAPTANAQSVSTTYQTQRTITLTGSDPNQPARTLTYAVATNPSHGTLSNLNAATGAVTYTPATGYAGADSFTFTVSNGTATSAPATVSITVQGPLATVSTVAPDQGPVGGNTSIVVTGTGFTGATALRVGGATATNFVVVNDSRITATTPPGTAGTASVAVVNATGTSTANGVFTYVAQPAAPVVTAPANGVTTNLRTPTYSGTAPAGTTVTVIVDNVAVGQTTANAGGGFSLPQPSALTDGSHTVRANASNAGGTSPDSATNSFTVDATAPQAPSITMPLNNATTTSRRPVISGSAEANSRVTITIDTDLAQSVTADANGLFSYTPAADIGIGQHSVYATATDAANNLSPRSATTSFTIVGAPTVTGITPTSGPNSGGTNVTIQGTNFVAGATVAFAGTQATNVTVVDANTITARTPQIVGSGAVDVAVTTGAGTGTRTGAFTYLAPPAAPVLTTPANNATITSRTPTYSGTAAAGATVAVFVNGAQVGTATATGGSFSVTQPTALGDATYTVYATATNGGGTSADSATTRFTVDATAPATPTIATPTSGQVFGTPTPTYSGTAEAGATVRVLVDGSIYTTTATGGSWTLQQPTPLGTGPHSISARAEDAAGNVSAYSGAVAFRVVGAPTIGSVSPARGPAAGGTTITITGSNLSGATRVQVGGADATILTNPDDATITARTPSGTAGAASVAVTNPAGTVTATNAFTYVAAPVAQAQDVTAGFNAATTIVLGASNSPTRYDIVPGDIPRHGSLTGTAPNLQYVPNSGYNGTDRFSFTATNDGGTSAPAIVSITVVPPTITINGSTPAGERGVAYPSTTLTATGGTAPYSIGLAPGSGPLPSGLSLRQTDRNVAVIDGTPTQSGTFQITVRAIDSSSPGVTVTRNFDIVIAGPTLSIAPGSLPAGTAGIAYSQTFSGSGGTGPYRFTLAEGTLPTGLALAADGTLSGTPTQAGSFPIRVAATDSSPASSGGPYTTTNTVGRYTLTIARPTITVAPPTIPNPRAGTPYSQAISASGGTGSYAYTVSSGALPAGLTLATSGVLSGTVTTGGDFTFEITATDANGFTGARIYTVTVAAATVTLAPTTLPNGTVAAAYSATVTASGGTAPYAYTVSAGTLPAGVTLAATGTLSGTPTAGGNFTFTIRATDSSTGNGPFSGERQYSVTIAAPAIAIAPDTLPGGSAGIAYDATLSASGGTAPYSFTLAAGTLPRGLTLATNGTLSGTPTQSGSFTFSVRATDASTGSGPYAQTRSYTIAISAPTLVLAPATLPNATVGTAYTQAVTASGGTAPYSYAVTAGALPTGVTLATDGTLSGTPSAGGSFTFTITATDATTPGNGGPYRAQRGYTLTVAAATVAIAPATLPAGTSGTAYSQTLSASGGTAPYSYAVTAGALPAGVTLATNGTLSGTPTQSGSFTFSVTATDGSTGSGPYAGTRSYTLAISAPALALAPATLADANVGTAYSATITASGGTAPYSYAVTAGALPAGVTLAANGTLSGTPTAGGNFAFTVTATDATTPANGGPYSVARGYTLAVSTATVTIAPATLPAGTSGVAYSQTLSASGGTAPYSYAVTAGALPAGVTLAANGTLSGTPTQSGSFTFSATATDSSTGSGPYAGTRSYTLTIAAPALTLAPATLANASVGTAYSATIAASGGTAPYSYAVTAGALPAGVTLAANGTLSGTPTAGGSFAFTVTATDATTPSNGGPYTASRAYTLTVAAPTVAVAPATLPAGTAQVAYSQTLSASGGTAPYAYAITAGALPAGITLTTDGTLSGTPTVGGSFTFTATATDSSTGTGPYAGSRSYTLTIAGAQVVLSPAALPQASVGTAYTQSITASGGIAPYGYRVTAGALPAGVTLATNGTLSGTPTAGGSFTFSVTATDSSGGSGPYSGTRSYTLTVAAATIAVTPAALPAGQAQVAYAQTLSASGGTAPYSFAVTAGALPAGLTLDATGRLSGTPTAQGDARFTVTATDSSTGSGPFTGATAYTLTIAAPAVPTAGNVSATVAYGSSDNPVPLAISGTIATSVSIATAPTHGTAVASGTTIRYTPAAGYAGPDSFTYTANNAGGSSAPATVSITVTSASVAIAPTTIPAAQQDVAYSQTLTATGGAAPYAFAVTTGRLPAGVTLSGGGVLSGTPTESGNFAFTVTATDSSRGTGPFSASQAYTLAVALPAPPVARNAADRTVAGAVAAGGASVDIDLSSLVSGNYSDIQVATAPRNGTVTLARSAGTGGAGPRVVATYTPAVGFRGTDSFTFVAVGAGGRSAPASASITVQGSAPTAPTLRATTIAGQAVIVDLTATATGGPFTAATILSASPGASVNATLIEGGTAGNRTYQLRLLPDGRFSGSAVVTYTLSNGFGASAPATVTLGVTARPDPAADANVRGIVTAQAESARRFAGTQTDNFMRRNEQLHGNGVSSMGSPMGVTVAGGDQQLAGGPVAAGIVSDVLAMKMEHATAVRGAEATAGLLSIGRDGRAMPMTGIAGARGRSADGTASGTLGAAAPQTGVPTADGADGRRIGSVALWSGGAVSVGTRDATTQRARLSVSSAGLSAGIDVKVADGVTLGAGGGYGSDRTKLARGAAQVDGDSWVGAAYGSVTPVDGLFVDGIVGAGGLGFDTRRTVTANGTVASGSRDGSMVFGSIATGLDRTTDRYGISAYGRVDYLSAKLDAYRETGSGMYDLAYARRDITSVAGILGGRAATRMGSFTPRIRLEWRHEFKDSGVQALDYADLAGLTYTIDGDRWLRDAYSAEIGTAFDAGRGWQLGIDVGGSLGDGAAFATGKVTIGKQF